MARGAKQHFADALGSVTRITDSTGARQKLMVYDSYGVMTTDSGSVQADYVSYTGREAERDLGIYYYRSRYYDPLTGRFMARDPLGFAAGDVNLYRYVHNNSTNKRDAFGLTDFIFYSHSLSGGVNPANVEGGQYYLINAETGEYHRWNYVSGGVGLGGGVSIQIEYGTYTGMDYPSQMSPWSFSISAFAAAFYSVSGQLTGTSFWGNGDLGYSSGVGFGSRYLNRLRLGAGIAGMLTFSWGYESGCFNDLPESIQTFIRDNYRR